MQVSGAYADGLLRASDWQPDLLASDPEAYFGTAVDRLSVEQFVGVGGVQLGDMPVSVPGTGLAGRGGPAVVDFVRGANGRMTATSVRGASSEAAPGAAFAPAPVPNTVLPGAPFGGGAGTGLPGGAGRMPFPAARQPLGDAGAPGGGPPPSASPPSPRR